MATLPVEVRFGIACDQIREEDNGKLFLIGVYAHNIALRTMPAELNLTAAIGIRAHDKVDAHQIDIRASFNGTTFYNASGRLSTKEAGTDLLVVPNIVLSADVEGRLQIKVKPITGRWKTVVDLPVERAAP